MTTTSLTARAPALMSSDEADDAAFRELLLADPRLAPVLSDAARFRAQVLLTEVVETSGAGTEACPHSRHTRLRRHAFRADAEYFYPASTVKLFGAIAACVALRELARAHPGLDKDTPLAFGAAPRGDDVPNETEHEATAKNTHSTASRDVTTLRAELAKLFLVSDNRAFNRCFDLCGPSGIRRWTARHIPGEDVRVTHRLFDDAGEAKQSEARGAELPEVWARLVNPNGDEGWVRVLERRRDECRFEEERSPLLFAKGRASYGRDSRAYRVGSSVRRAQEGDVVAGGLDCVAKNRCSLRALQRAALVLARPDLVHLDQRHEDFTAERGKNDDFTICSTTSSLHPEDRECILLCAAAAPRDAAACGVTAAADIRRSEAKPDEYNKFFLPGIRRALRERVAESGSNDPSVSYVDTYRPVVTNKLGRAYGFSVDNAHVRVDVVRSVDPNGEKRKKIDDDDDDDDERFREFFLAVAVETNENGVVNDDAYEYEAVADPFLEAVAEVAAKFAWDPKRRERGE
jgi:hypothetical protein